MFSIVLTFTSSSDETERNRSSFVGTLHGPGTCLHIYIKYYMPEILKVMSDLSFQMT
jgi:hypothetical protein